jgi:predicted O-methyltransferase YrrM
MWGHRTGLTEADFLKADAAAATRGLRERAHWVRRPFTGARVLDKDRERATIGRGTERIRLKMLSLDELLAQPPLLHMDRTVTWSISEDLVRFLDASVKSTDTVLETGSGLSTLVFLRKGVAKVVSITPLGDSEFAAIRAYCAEKGIDARPLEGISRRSEEYLPSASVPPLDVILIDGRHGFPTPFIDWFYTARQLKTGGLMVVDDLQIATGMILADFMAADRDWEDVLRPPEQRFAVFRKAGHGVLDGDWYTQEYLKASAPVTEVRLVQCRPPAAPYRFAQSIYARQPEQVRALLRPIVRGVRRCATEAGTSLLRFGGRTS